jgi:hypothetical protein
LQNFQFGASIDHHETALNFMKEKVAKSGDYEEKFIFLIDDQFCASKLAYIIFSNFLGG